MIAISQPTFFPWIGYFDIIDQVDVFVLLDDVDFSKQSWHQRNKFKTTKSLEWFTIPVKIVSSRKINRIEILNRIRLSKKFKNFVKTNYSKSTYFENYSEDIFNIFDKTLEENNLAKLNFKIINFCLKLLNIKTKIELSSKLNIKKKRSEKITEICKLYREDQYLSSYGAKDYLKEDKHIFEREKIKVFLHNYHHPEYNQLNPPFKSNASILDLIFNEGKNSLKIIKKGRKESIKLY
tara:strand:+ start:4415 stop:5125 length:711 start_codon:yes stop_codon:yes gene_type:complete